MLYNRSNADLRLQDLNPIEDMITPYHLTTYNSTSLTAGISYKSSYNYKMSTDGKHRRYRGSVRYYLNFSYAVNSNYQVYYSSETNPTNEGFIAPTFSGSGWRFGMDMGKFLMNSNLGMTYGFEFGRSPQYSSEYNGNPYLTNASSLLMVHLGLIFGAKMK